MRSRRAPVDGMKDDEAAAAWTMAAEILVKEGATILTSTHSPYSDDGRIRGSSHLWGSFEGRLHAEGDKEKRTCVLKVDRFKDRDSNGQWGFQLDEVEIEEHPGETSLVPRLDDEVKSQKSGKKQLKTRAAAALKTLRYAIDELGAVPHASNHVPSNTKCVTLDQWQDYALRLGISTSDDERAKKQAFRLGSEYLIENEHVGFWRPFVWIR